MTAPLIIVAGILAWVLFAGPDSPWRRRSSRTLTHDAPGRERQRPARHAACIFRDYRNLFHSGRSGRATTTTPGTRSRAVSAGQGLGDGRRPAGRAERNGIQPTSSRPPAISGTEAAQERHARSQLAPRSAHVIAHGAERVPQSIRDRYRTGDTP